MAKDDNPFFDLAGSEIRSIPQSELEKFIGSFGKRAESLGKSMAEPLTETKKVAPIKSFLAQMLITDPLQSAGTALQDWSHTPRENTSERPYTPSPFYGGSPATLNPNTWGPALQTFRTDPRAVDVASLAQPAGALARAATTKVAKPLARAAGEAMTQRMLSGESMIPGLPQSVAPNPLTFAVKPKGSNWRPAPKGQRDDIAQAMLPIEQRGPTTREAAIAEGGQWRMQTDEFGNPYTFADSPEGQRILENTGALNRWLNKKLKPYIQNELGTPDDPIRLAHEQGYSHMPAFAEHGEWIPDTTVTMRRQAGFPEEGFAARKHAEAGYPEANAANAQSAENWENLSDSLINSGNARRYQGFADMAREFKDAPPAEYQYYLDVVDQNPWLAKADPNTKLYELVTPTEIADQLGFKHMVDELRASLSPNSELPEHLRLTPETLNKVNIADAVKRVSEINSWRALEAEKAELAGMMDNLNANSRLADPTAQLSFVKKPGMTWTDVPEVVDEKGVKLCTSIGRQGGWCTMNADTAKNYGSGDNRLVALLDAEGRPHAQAMISTSNYDHSQMHLGDVLGGEDAVGDQYYRNLQTLLERRGINPEDAQSYVELEAGGDYRGLPSDIRDLMNELSSEAESMIPKKQLPLPDIVELKPPGNTFSSNRSKTYEKRDPKYKGKISDSVLKFLNSGEWGSVNDLDIYGITDINRPDDVLQTLKRMFRYTDGKQMGDHSKNVLSNAPTRFMSEDQFKKFAESQLPSPAEGYAEGGAVHMQVGGLASLARRLFKAPVAELGRAGIMSKSGKILTETFTPEELELIQNSIVMSRRKTLDDLAGADKRLKSVHETNRTGAASGPLRSKQARAEREPQMFGGLGQAYGYLTLDPLATLSGELSPRFPTKGTSHIAPTSQIPEYGRFGLVLHPELRGRTTFTIDDSLDRTLGSKTYPKEILRSMPYENSVEPGSVLHDLVTDYDALSNSIVENLKAQGTPQWKIPERLAEELAKINKPATFADLLRSEGLPPMDDGSGYFRLPRQIPRMLDNPTEPSLLSSEIYQLGSDDPTHFRNKLLQRDPMGYVEAQVHGDVTPENIQRIYDFGYEPSLKAEKQAKKLGIDYIPRPPAAYDIIKRANPQTMGEFYRLAEELGVLPSYLKGRESDSPMLPFGGNYAKGGKVSTNPFDHLI